MCIRDRNRKPNQNHYNQHKNRPFNLSVLEKQENPQKVQENSTPKQVDCYGSLFWWKLLIGENNKEEQTHVENRPYNLKHNWWDIDRGHFFLLYKRNNKKPMFQGYEKTNKSNKTIIKKHIIWFPSSQQWEDW